MTFFNICSKYVLKNKLHKNEIQIGNTKFFLITVLNGILRCQTFADAGSKESQDLFRKSKKCFQKDSEITFYQKDFNLSKDRPLLP